MTISRIRNFGIIAHIDAGKTTTTERVLYYTTRIHRVGNVDEGTTTTDWYELERKRGISIFSAAVTCEWRDHMLNLIDTPGHVDFTAEVERSLRVLDGAVIVFDGVHGVEAQSEMVWRQAVRYRVPRLAYVNKMDRPGANYLRALESMRKKLGARPVPVAIAWGAESSFRGVIDLVRRKALSFEGDHGEEIREHDIPAEQADEVELLRHEMMETASEFSDRVLESLVEGREPDPADVRAGLRAGTIAGKIQPAFAGSSLHSQGVQTLLDGVVDFLPSPEDVPVVEGREPETGKPASRDLRRDSALCAVAFKTESDRHGELTYVRVYSGKLTTRDSFLNPRTGKTERVGRIFRMFSHERSEQLQEAGPGEIVAAVGLKLTLTGDTLCDPKRPIVLGAMTFPEPVVVVSVEPRSSADRDRLDEVLQRLTRDDPTFRATTDEETGQTLLHCMGELHTEILLHRITNDFGVPARVGEPRVAYKETILSPARGEDRQVISAGEKTLFGHVAVEIRPSRSEVKPVVRVQLGAAEEKALARFLPSIREGLYSAAQSGEIAGYPMIYLEAVVVGGSVTPESSEAAYSAASVHAFRKALQGTKSALLEPHMRFDVTVPDDYVGDVLNDLNRRGAQIEDMEAGEGVKVLRGNVALSKMFGYATSIRSITQGRGAYSLEPFEYRPVPEQEVQQRMGSLFA